MCILADLIGRGVVPVLEMLDIGVNPNITDVGVLAPAEAMLKSTQMHFVILSLYDVVMGDEGVGFGEAAM